MNMLIQLHRWTAALERFDWLKFKDGMLEGVWLEIFMKKCLFCA